MILPPLQLLFLEGDPGDRMYVIRKGKVRIMKREGAHMATLAELGPGAILGEMSLLDNQPRSATAKTLETTELVEIDQAMLEAVFLKMPIWLTTIVRMVVQRLRETTARKYRDDVNNAMNACLFLLDAAVQLTPNQEIPLSPISERLKGIYGLSTNDFFKIIERLEQLKLVHSKEEKITVPDPLLIHQLYEILLDRASPKPNRKYEISEQEIQLLTLLTEQKLVDDTVLQQKYVKVAYSNLPDQGKAWMELSRAQHIQWIPNIPDGSLPSAEHIVAYDPQAIKRLLAIHRVINKLKVVQ